MAAEEHGRDQHRLDAQPRQRERLGAATDPAGGHEAGEDEDAGHDAHIEHDGFRRNRLTLNRALDSKVQIAIQRSS
jgi:hypothetical protein